MDMEKLRHREPCAVCGRHRDSDKAILSLLLCPHWKALLPGFAMAREGPKVIRNICRVLSSPPRVCIHI